MAHNLAPFAAVNALINQGVSTHLADAVCVIDGGQPFGVIFNRQPKDALDIYGGYAPTLSFALANAPAVGQGSAVVVEGVGSFEVVQPVEPDATGWVTLQLREAPLPAQEEGASETEADHG